MADLQVREATPADLPAVGTAWSHLQEFHQGLGLAFPVDSEKWLASFQRTLGRFSFLWVVGEAGKPVAFLLARVKQSPAFLGGMQVGEISDLYVDESLRGSGAGTQLVEAAMRKLQELGVHSVEVQIQAGNEAGLDFWIKQGFKPDLTLVRKVL
ncbi:MAG: GNAT family N-acetyltransferase [Anaerolineales bacterium]